MLLSDFEKKHKDTRITLKGGDVSICVGEDKSDPRRMEVFSLSDFTLKMFRSKWAILERKWGNYYSNSEAWYD